MGISMKRGLMKKWREVQWPLIAGTALATLVLGLIGFSRYFVARADRRPFSNILYVTIQLFVLESGSVPGPVPWQLELARFLAPLISASAAVIGLARIFRLQFQLLMLRS